MKYESKSNSGTEYLCAISLIMIICHFFTRKKRALYCHVSMLGQTDKNVCEITTVTVLTYRQLLLNRVAIRSGQIYSTGECTIYFLKLQITWRKSQTKLPKRDFDVEKDLFGVKCPKIGIPISVQVCLRFMRDM